MSMTVDSIRKATREGACCVGYQKMLLDEIDRLRAMIEQTADDVLVPDCDRMFCPKCTGELRLEYDLAYCDSCVNPDGYDKPPLPLLFACCYSTRQAAIDARDKR
jgi:hypothetical protein